MSFTPRIMVFAARGALALSAAGAATCIASAEPLPPIALTTGAFATSLLTLLAFPRIRRNELLVAVAACSALTGYLTMPGSFAAAAAGLAGPAIVALTLSVIRVRNLAASNWHMSFVEWRQFDRRRKRQSEETKAVTVQFTQHQADRAYRSID